MRSVDGTWRRSTSIKRQAGPRPLDLDDAVAAAVDAPGSAYREVVLPLDLYSF